MKKCMILILGWFFLFSPLFPTEKTRDDAFILDVKPAKPTPLNKDAFAWLDAHFTELSEMNEKIWHFAEVAMEEYRSSELLASYLENNGFQVSRGVAGMPTAFVAVYGSGQPAIGILAEYDALPGLSQEGVPYKKPLTAGIQRSPVLTRPAGVLWPGRLFPQLLC